MRNDLLKELDKARVGARLRLIRRIADKTQDQFAADAGLSRTQYNQWEKGQKMPSLDGATLLCLAYDLDLNFIFHGDLSGLRQRTVDAMKALAAASDDTRTAD